MSDLTPADLARFVHPVPVPAPEPSLAERARILNSVARMNSDVTLGQLALIVAELADRIEAER